MQAPLAIRPTLLSHALISACRISSGVLGVGLGVGSGGGCGCGCGGVGSGGGVDCACTVGVGMVVLLGWAGGIAALCGLGAV